MWEIKPTFNGTKKVGKCHKAIIKEIPVNHQIQGPMQIDQECKNLSLANKDKNTTFSKTLKPTVVINLSKPKFIKSNMSN